jgi:5-methylcytosine-specific restriction protein A
VDFTPADGSTNARAACTSAVNRQARNGYILDYVTRAIDKPNPGFEDSLEYRHDQEQHDPVAGRLIAVHRLRPGTGRSQREIIGDAAFERLQDMWARDGNRVRWSVAFPIVETYEIEDPPYAIDVLGADSYRRLFAHPATLLRPLNDGERTKLADLMIKPRPATNAWIAIEDEVRFALQDEKKIPPAIRRSIEIDLTGAMEGFSEERRVMIRMRAAWQAYKYVLARQTAGRLICDDCDFNPAVRIAGRAIRPRSLLDVHHREPLAEGIRYTASTDAYFTLLCPTCHRLEHALLSIRGTT